MENKKETCDKRPEQKNLLIIKKENCLKTTTGENLFYFLR